MTKISDLLMTVISMSFHRVFIKIADLLIGGNYLGRQKDCHIGLLEKMCTKGFPMLAVSPFWHGQMWKLYNFSGLPFLEFTDENVVSVVYLYGDSSSAFSGDSNSSIWVCNAVTTSFNELRETLPKI